MYELVVAWLGISRKLRTARVIYDSEAIWKSELKWNITWRLVSYTWELPWIFWERFYKRDEPGSEQSMFLITWNSLHMVALTIRADIPHNENCCDPVYWPFNHSHLLLRTFIYFIYISNYSPREDRNLIQGLYSKYYFKISNGYIFQMVRATLLKLKKNLRASTHRGLAP